MGTAVVLIEVEGVWYVLIVEGIVALKVVLPFAFVANSFGPPTDSVKTETMLETRQQVKNGTTTNEQPRITTTSGPTIDDILIDLLLELDKTTLIRPF
jgi:hypothetical protein